MKDNTIELLERNVGENLHTPSVGKDFWNKAQNWLMVQEETDKLDYIKIRNFCLSQ